jgi:hypothetical protein
LGVFVPNRREVIEIWIDFVMRNSAFWKRQPRWIDITLIQTQGLMGPGKYELLWRSGTRQEQNMKTELKEIA